MTVALLVLHGLAAMLLLGALTHQAIALWWPAPARGGRWWAALRAVHPERYTRAVIVLLLGTVLVGSLDYVPFRSVTRFEYLDRYARWATGLFEIKEHAAALALALAPAYAAAWRAGEGAAGRRALTTVLAAAAWWSFLVGHIVNNVRGL